MNYIVFDLEFNQPLLKEQLVLDPFPFCFEIIQIGAVKMDENFKIKATIDIMVKPRYYKHIGNSAKKRIEIYSKHFQQVMTFPKAYERFLEFCGNEYCLFSWGANDIEILNRNILIHGLQPNRKVKCFDVQKLFAEHFTDIKSQIGLQDAIKKMHLERYTAHNAFNDAYSTAEILSKLMIDPKRFEATNKIINYDNVLYVDEKCFSKADAIKKAKESKITCGCGAQVDIGRMIFWVKAKLSQIHSATVAKNIL